MDFNAYRSCRQSQDRVRLHNKGRIRQNGFCRGIEVGTAWMLEEVGVAIDKRVDARVVQAKRVVVRWVVSSSASILVGSPALALVSYCCARDEGQEEGDWEGETHNAGVVYGSNEKAVRILGIEN